MNANTKICIKNLSNIRRGLERSVRRLYGLGILMVGILLATKLKEGIVVNSNSFTSDNEIWLSLDFSMHVDNSWKPLTCSATLEGESTGNGREGAGDLRGNTRKYKMERTV